MLFKFGVCSFLHLHFMIYIYILRFVYSLIKIKFLSSINLHILHTIPALYVSMFILLLAQKIQESGSAPNQSLLVNGLIPTFCICFLWYTLIICVCMCVYLFWYYPNNIPGDGVWCISLLSGRLSPSLLLSLSLDTLLPEEGTTGCSFDSFFWQKN